MIGSFRLPISITSSGDTTAPTITTATVEDANPDKLVVVFSESVTIVDVTGLTITGAVTPTLSAPTGTGTNTITFTLSTALTNGQSVTLNVASSNTIKDAANNSLAATTKAITNNVEALLLLDIYPGAEVAYSFRKLRANYTGQCIRVRRSSDNVESDIGFNGNYLATDALLSFIGSVDGHIVRKYDQSLNGFPWEQTNSTQQPRIVVAGVLTRDINNNIGMKSVNNERLGVTIPLPSGKTSPVLSTDFNVISNTTSIYYAIAIDIYSDQGTYWGAGQSGISSSIIDVNVGNPIYYVNSNLFTGTTRGNIYNLTSGGNVKIFTAKELTLELPININSAHSSSSVPALEFWYEKILYLEDLDTATRQGIENNIIAYYNIT